MMSLFGGILDHICALATCDSKIA